MGAPHAATRPADPDLAAVLQAAATELVELSTVADSLGLCPSMDMERWQTLDRVSQHLAELAGFLSRVAVLVPDLRPDMAEAFAAIRLGKLVNRLVTQTDGFPDDAAGELEMFGA